MQRLVKTGEKATYRACFERTGGNMPPHRLLDRYVLDPKSPKGLYVAKELVIFLSDRMRLHHDIHCSEGHTGIHSSHLKQFYEKIEDEFPGEKKYVSLIITPDGFEDMLGSRHDSFFWIVPEKIEMRYDLLHKSGHSGEKDQATALPLFVRNEGAIAPGEMRAIFCAEGVIRTIARSNLKLSKKEGERHRVFFTPETIHTSYPLNHEFDMLFLEPALKKVY